MDLRVQQTSKEKLMSDTSLYYSQSTKPTPEELGVVIDEEVKKAGEYNPLSKTAEQDRAVMLPEEVNSRVKKIQKDGPTNPAEFQEIEVLTEIERANAEKTSPEIMAEATAETTAIVSNLSRVESGKTTALFRESLLNQNLLNEENQLDDAAFDKITKEALVLLRMYNPNESIELFRDLESTQIDFKDSLLTAYSDLMESNRTTGVKSRIDLYKLMGDVFREMYGEGLSYNTQTPFDNIYTAFLPAGAGSISEETEKAIEKQLEVQLTPEVPDLAEGSIDFQDVKKADGMDKSRLVIDSVLNAYRIGNTSDGNEVNGRDLFANRINVYNAASQFIVKSLTDFTSGELDENTDYRYLAEMLNEMGVANIDTSREFSAGDVPIYLQQFEQALNILENNVSGLEKAYVDVTSPQKRYERLVGKYLGRTVGQSLTTGAQISSLIDDVLNNPDNYSRSKRLHILTTYVQASNVFASLLETEEKDTKFMNDLDALNRNILNPGNYTDQAQSVFQMFGANEDVMNGVREQHPVALEIMDKSISFWNDAYKRNYEMMVATLPENMQPDSPTAPNIMQVLSQAMPGWTFGNDIPWENMDQMNKLVMAETLIQAAAERNLSGTPDILNSLDGFFQRSFEIMDNDFLQMNAADKAMVLSTVHLMQYMLDSSNLASHPSKRKIVRDLVTGDATGAEREKRFRGLQLFSKRIKQGGGNLFASVDFAGVMADPFSAESQAALAQMHTLYVNEMQYLQGLIGSMYSGDIQFFAPPRSLFGEDGRIVSVEGSLDDLANAFADLGISFDKDDSDAVENLELSLMHIYGDQLTPEQKKQVDASKWNFSDENINVSLPMRVNALLSNAYFRRDLNTAYAALNKARSTRNIDFTFIDVLDLAGFKDQRPGVVKMDGVLDDTNTDDDDNTIYNTTKQEWTDPAPPRYKDQEEEWEMMVAPKKMRVLFQDYNGPTNVETDEQIENFQSLAIDLYNRQTGSDLVQDRMNERMRIHERGFFGEIGDAFADIVGSGPRTQEVNRFLREDLNRATYEAVDMSWAASSNVTTMLEQNFDATENPYLFRLAASIKIGGSKRGMTPEQFNENIVRPAIARVQQRYSSREVSYELFDLVQAEKNKRSPGPSPMDSKYYEDFMARYKPTLMDLHVAVMIELDENGGIGEGFRRGNRDYFGGGKDVSRLQSVDRYPDVRFDPPTVEMRQNRPAKTERSSSGAIYRADQNGKPIAGQDPISVYWVFDQNAQFILDNPTNKEHTSSVYLSRGGGGSRLKNWTEKELGRRLSTRTYEDPFDTPSLNPNTEYENFLERNPEYQGGGPTYD